jgi:GTP cyclohydrolase IB
MMVTTSPKPVLSELKAPTLSAQLPLEDVQGRPDSRGIALKEAGVCGVKMPLQIRQKDGTSQQVAATVTMSVGLPPQEKGTHMSRFVVQLAQWSRGKVLNLSLKSFIEEMANRLDATSAYVSVSFPFFIDKKAPVTDGSAPMAVHCALTAQLEQGTITLGLQYKMAIATLCPCSKAISEYGAHNQRAELMMNLRLDESAIDTLSLEDLMILGDQAASCPVFPLLKRADEKWVTERQYTNAKFVEDVVRDMALLLRVQPAVAGFSVRVEALESIHDHNAFASYEERLQA